MIEVICFMCERPLDEPGAVLLTPPATTGPDGSMLVEKMHACVECWNHLMDAAVVLAGGRGDRS